MDNTHLDNSIKGNQEKSIIIMNNSMNGVNYIYDSKFIEEVYKCKQKKIDHKNDSNSISMKPNKSTYSVIEFDEEIADIIEEENLENEMDNLSLQMDKKSLPLTKENLEKLSKGMTA